MNVIKTVFNFIKSHKIISILSFVIILVLVFILKPKQSAAITTQKIVLGDITQTVSVTGNIAAKKSADLSFTVDGTISWVGVKKGDIVTQGQTLATLDERTALKNLQKSLTAYSIARNTFDQTISDNGNTQNPNSAVNDTEKRILQTNQYNLDQAVNSVELQDLARQQSILSTPISGIVSTANVKVPGSTAVLGTTLFSVVDPSSVVFDMDVDEADIGKIKIGQKVNITLDAYPTELLTLPIDSIDFVSHTTTSGGNAYTVSVKLGSNNNYKYKIGMNGNADIITAKKSNVIIIPLEALVNNNEVYVKASKGFVLHPVSLGLQSDTQAEVTSGLSVGDIIATSPTQVTKN